MRMKTSRSLFRLILGLMLGVLASTAAWSQEKSKLRVSVIPIIDVAPLFAASQQGYFRDAGLEIDTSPVAGGAVGIPGLVGGTYDIVFTNVVSAVLAKQQGIDLRIIAPASGGKTTLPDVAAIVVMKGQGLKTGADFTGKGIAVNTRNNIIWLYAREWVARSGGDVRRVNMREIPFPQMLDALKRKQVDAIFVGEPFLSIGRADPSMEIIAYPYHAVQPGISIAQYVAMADFIAKNPETVRRFAAAVKKGAKWVNENVSTPAFAHLLASYTRMPPDRIQNLVKPDAPLSVGADSIRKTISIMEKHGLMTAPVNAEELVFDTAK